VLLMLVITICLSALAAGAIARTAQVVMRRRGLDTITVLLWLGLADWPREPRAPRARESKQAVLEGPARGRRRRSPHRPRVHPGARRRPVLPPAP